ncbi:unnamed protein product [Acanthoscelides obtectus]|uniref:Uncharacterized protein n=1 Tax=Acanthoscelides obtectus TaxID=200917 RepID=A0A9P0LIC0_ACAOB|nr:unnamed protein product [Acanthoscelides obtectus]CAK1664918.1 hypothetical protein AOBTE_LOCUS24550 [Acanthoscelides obtectus]
MNKKNVSIMSHYKMHGVVVC